MVNDGRLVAALERSRALGFLGPGPVAFHVEHARAFEPQLPIDSTVVDLGSGGGVPGLVLAVERPDLRLLLLDANRRRCTFLDEAIGALGAIDRVTVIEGRAEELARMPELRSSADAVVSRSFGSPAVTAECGSPFLRVGGSLVVSEPPDVSASDNRWPADGLAQLGLRDRGRLEHEGVGIRVLEQQLPCPEGFPRRTGVPAKRPLF